MSLRWDNEFADMTSEQAQQIREWRVGSGDMGCSWRSIAQAAYDKYAGQWEPPWNQIAGMDLCQRAATMMGEDYMRPPWN